MIPFDLFVNRRNLQLVSLNDWLNELTIGFLQVIRIYQINVIVPIVLRVVLVQWGNINRLFPLLFVLLIHVLVLVCILHKGEVLGCIFVVVVSLEAESHLRMQVHQPVNAKRIFWQPCVLTLGVVHLLERFFPFIDVLLYCFEVQFIEILDPDGAWKHLYQPICLAMVVHNRGVVGRPYFQHGHASRTQSFVRKQLKPDVVGSGLDLFKQISSSLIISYIEKLILCLILHFVKVVKDTNRPFADLFAAFFHISISIGPNQAILNGKPQVTPD